MTPTEPPRLALLVYADGEKRYILAPVGLKVGDTIVSGPNAEIRTGNSLPIANIPVGTLMHNVELKPGKGGQMVRAAGSAAQLLAKEGELAQIRLPSGEVRLVRQEEGFSGGSNMPAYPYQGPPQPGWARSVERLSTGYIPDAAMNINVQGRLPTGPVKGFGRLWDKRYRLRIGSGALGPREIVSLWKSEFADFWPGGKRFFPADGAAIAPARWPFSI